MKSPRTRFLLVLCCMLLWALTMGRLFLLQSAFTCVMIVCYALLVLASVRAPAGTWRAVLPWYVLGAAIPIAPVTGSGALLMMGMCAAAGVLCRADAPDLRFAAPLLLLLVVWVGALCAQDFDPERWHILYEGRDGPGASGLANIAYALRMAPPQWIVSAEQVSRLLVLLVLFAFFAADVPARIATCRGFLFAFPVPAIIALLSAVGMMPLALPSMTHFWLMQRRFAGTFTDPNAFGVVYALSVPLLAVTLVRQPRAVALPAALGAVLVLCAAVVSGSRSFVLGIALFAALWLVRWNRRVSVLALCTGLLLLGAWNALLALETSGTALLIDALPVGAARVLRTLSWPTIREAMFSRAVFFETALRVWIDHPVTGVGPGMFKNLVPWYSLRSGADIGMWVDNANNWYLQILAETGLIGLAAYAVVLRRLTFKTDAERVLLPVVPVLALLLFVGPHFDFDEVAIFSALLLATVIEPRPVAAGMGKGAQFLWAAAFSLVAAAGLLGDEGFFGYERDGAKLFRWTGRRASATMHCNEDRSARLRIQAALPFEADLHVRISADGAVVRDMGMKGRGPQPIDVKLQCREGADMLRYTLEVDRPWTPRKYGLGEDSRLLGVRVLQ